MKKENSSETSNSDANKSTKGFIKLSRSFLEWEWYNDVNTKVTFLELLFRANFKDQRYKGKLVKRGQCIIGLTECAESIGITVQMLRTSLKHLEKSGEINKQSNNHGTLITICKYETYQGEYFKPTSTPTNHQQTTNKQLTTINKDNKDNKEIYTVLEEAKFPVNDEDITEQDITDIIKLYSTGLGKVFKNVKSNRELISFLLDRHNKTEITTVIELISTWPDNVKSNCSMNTLCNESKFEGYLSTAQSIENSPTTKMVNENSKFYETQLTLLEERYGEGIPRLIQYYDKFIEMVVADDKLIKRTPVGAKLFKKSVHKDGKLISVHVMKRVIASKEFVFSNDLNESLPTIIKKELNRD